MISHFQLITQDLKKFSHIEQVRMACENGAKWIQLRAKNKNYNDWIKIASESIRICREYGAKLIINDSVQVALEIDADGVLLGRDDMPIHSARALLGENKIIGGTGNSHEDLLRIAKEGADYAVMGPYKFTPTKMNFKSLLGINSYSKLIHFAKENEIDIPIIAIGGIKLKDVDELFSLGVHGIAVSSAVFSANDPAKALKSLMEKVGEKVPSMSTSVV
ncbi:MAG TPA: thiamine phosphate synthase [Chitinophagales bacterium]|nr:thiamine phosphate synthase [Chitinophagales bacterium]